MLCILNVGTVPMLCVLNVGTVPTLCFLNVGTVPTFSHSQYVILHINKKNGYKMFLGSTKVKTPKHFWMTNIFGPCLKIHSHNLK